MGQTTGQPGSIIITVAYIAPTEACSRLLPMYLSMFYLITLQ